MSGSIVSRWAGDLPLTLIDVGWNAQLPFYRKTPDNFGLSYPTSSQFPFLSSPALGQSQASGTVTAGTICALSYGQFNTFTPTSTPILTSGGALAFYAGQIFDLEVNGFTPSVNVYAGVGNVNYQTGTYDPLVKNAYTVATQYNVNPTGVPGRVCSYKGSPAMVTFNRFGTNVREAIVWSPTYGPIDVPCDLGLANVNEPDAFCFNLIEDTNAGFWAGQSGSSSWQTMTFGKAFSSPSFANATFDVGSELVYSGIQATPLGPIFLGNNPPVLVSPDSTYYRRLLFTAGSANAEIALGNPQSIRAAWIDANGYLLLYYNDDPTSSTYFVLASYLGQVNSSPTFGTLPPYSAKALAMICGGYPCGALPYLIGSGYF